MTKSKALMGKLTGKHVAGYLGGAVSTIAVLNDMRPWGWGDVICRHAEAISGGIALKQMDDGARDAFILVCLG